MKFLTDTRMSLVDLVTSSDKYYLWAKTKCTTEAKVTHIFDLLDKSRDFIKDSAPGSNIIRYFLHKMNNKIMRRQYSRESCEMLSNLHFRWGCIPFDKMPYATSLIKHNPRIYDLFECINPSNREHEFLARAIQNNTEQNGVLFTPLTDLERFEDINSLIKNSIPWCMQESTLNATYKYTKTICISRGMLMILRKLSRNLKNYLQQEYQATVILLNLGFPKIPLIELIVKKNSMPLKRYSQILMLH